MNNLIRISVITLKDQMRQKSFYILLAIAVVFVLLIRGCYKGDYAVNGRQVESAAVAWHASLIVFHFIAAAMFLMTSMLSMGIFSRDRDDGSMVMFLSRCVDRWQYVLGRIAGIWVLSTAFMFILHLTIFLIALANTGEMISGYLAASLLCSVNLLFAIVLTCALSLCLPNFVAASFTLMVIGISFISDGAYQVMKSELVRQMISSEGHVSLWRIVFPKVYMLQHYASTWITNKAFDSMPPVYVLANIVFYTGVMAAFALWRYSRSEV
ncbi:MAG: ABC transporter permease [Desulfobacteraceae bacterium]|nr:MAG: ABC transporter permease [Desulfobacteraceae bacterium]